MIGLAVENFNFIPLCNVKKMQMKHLVNSAIAAPPVSVTGMSRVASGGNTDQMHEETAAIITLVVRALAIIRILTLPAPKSVGSTPCSSSVRMLSGSAMTRSAVIGARVS